MALGIDLDPARLQLPPIAERDLLARALQRVRNTVAPVANTAPGAFLDFCRRRSVPRWQEGPHHQLICDIGQEAVVRAAEHRGVDVILSAPPRHGKSHTTTVLLPAWAIGSFADFPVIVTSYGAKLARSKSREARNLLEEIGEREFGIVPDQGSHAADEWHVAGGTSGMRSAGVRGPIVGHGARLGIIDDPFKDWREAHSALIRESVWDWYRSTFATRIEAGGSTVVIMTRWHEDDLAGRLMKEEGRIEEGGRWHVVELLAVIDSEEDARRDALGRSLHEVLWPARWPPDVIEERRQRLGSYQFEALFQQRPQSLEGGLLKRRNFRYWRPCMMELDGEKEPQPGFELQFSEGSERVLASDCWSLLSADTALSLDKSADYTVIEEWVVTPPIRGLRRRLLRNVIREQLEQPDQLPLFERTYRASDARIAAIEAAAAGLAAVQHLQRRERLAIHACKADRDKVARALPLSAAYEAQQVFHLEGAPWLLAYEAELLGFPHAEHDDQVDAAAYMELTLRELEDIPRPRAYTTKRDPERGGHLRRRQQRAERESKKSAKQAEPVRNGKATQPKSAGEAKGQERRRVPRAAHAALLDLRRERER